MSTGMVGSDGNRIVWFPTIELKHTMFGVIVFFPQINEK